MILMELLVLLAVDWQMQTLCLGMVGAQSKSKKMMALPQDQEEMKALVDLEMTLAAKAGAVVNQVVVAEKAAEVKAAAKAKGAVALEEKEKEEAAKVAAKEAVEEVAEEVEAAAD